jgi:16S rRNA (uracil1498-N3)-methyltransferase
LTRRRPDKIVRTHRVYTDLALAPGETITLQGKSAHYLGRVLRVATGQTVVLFNGDGRDYVCEVSGAGKNELALDVMTRLPARPESPLNITVVQAVSRGERMDQTLQKCTELGAAAFQPLWSERVEVRLKGEKLEKRQRHWQGVVISACEQSGRARVPEVRPAMALSDWVLKPSSGIRLVLAPGAEQGLAAVAVEGAVALLVGPEGGFSEAELGLVSSSGVHVVGLGPRILRTETAAPAAVAVLQALRGDLGN